MNRQRSGATLGNPCQGEVSTPRFAAPFISGDAETRINSGIAEPRLVKWGMQLPKTQHWSEAHILRDHPRPLDWEYDDGGRADAGFKGEAGDCATRAIAIATGLPYRDVYDDLAHYAGRSVRDGTPRKAVDTYLGGELKWEWVPTMGIGTGCQVHLRMDELPFERLVVRVSKHWTAAIYNTIRDTHDPTRDGTRCVYGFWIKG